MYKKHSKKVWFYNFSQIFLSKSFIPTFIMSDLSESITVAHLSWATWAIRSRLLFWHEQPERFAHSRSFVLSDLRKSPTVSHLIWAIWVNERWAYEQNPSPAKKDSVESVKYELKFFLIVLTVFGHFFHGSRSESKFLADPDSDKKVQSRSKTLHWGLLVKILYLISMICKHLYWYFLRTIK